MFSVGYIVRKKFCQIIEKSGKFEIFLQCNSDITLLSTNPEHNMMFSMANCCSDQQLCATKKELFITEEAIFDGLVGKIDAFHACNMGATPLSGCIWVILVT